jgi:hypothetical protein
MQNDSKDKVQGKERRELTAAEEVAKLDAALAKVPVGLARPVREVVQKEFEADVRAHEALITRGNTMLGATGVAVSLLVGLSRDAAINTDTELLLLVVALFAATLAMLLVVLGLRIKGGSPAIDNLNIAGDLIKEDKNKDGWVHDHDVSVAMTYFNARLELRERHHRRGTIFAVAQVTFLAFLASVCALGIAIPY